MVRNDLMIRKFVLTKYTVMNYISLQHHGTLLHGHFPSQLFLHSGHFILGICADTWRGVGNVFSTCSLCNGQVEHWACRALVAGTRSYVMIAVVTFDTHLFSQSSTLSTLKVNLAVFIAAQSSDIARILACHTVPVPSAAGFILGDLSGYRWGSSKART